MQSIVGQIDQSRQISDRVSAHEAVKSEIAEEGAVLCMQSILCAMLCQRHSAM